MMGGQSGLGTHAGDGGCPMMGGMMGSGQGMQGMMGSATPTLGSGCKGAWGAPGAVRG